MRLEKASAKAIKYACINFHYAKRIPAQPIVAYSVFNKKNEWCGCICFNAGIEGIQKPYGLKIGEVAELVRMALNGKQESTSKALSLAIKIFSKENPLVKMLISYADTDENHVGVIYQATNWIYELSKKTSDNFLDIKTGKQIHSRQISKSGIKKQFGVLKKCYTYSDVYKIKKGIKHKYIYPLCKSMLPLCKQLAKPYPKKALEVHAVEHLTPSQEVGGSSPTPALQNREKTEDNAE